MTSFNQSVPNATLKDLLDAVARNTKLSINCHAIGRIEKFDKDTQLCNVKIVYVKTIITRRANGKYKKSFVEYPLLLGCPAINLYGGDSGLTMPIKQGDECLVLFNDRDIDNWLEGASTSELATNRLHSISDGFALVGIRSKRNTLENYDPDNPVLFNGKTKISIKDGKVLIEHDGQKLGDLFNDLRSALTSITTNPVSTGSPATLNTATINAINNAFDAITELLE